MTRSEDDLCLLACRIWNIELLEEDGEYCWVDLDIRPTSKSRAKIHSYTIRLLVSNFKNKYLKSSRRYNTPEMKLRRVLMNGSED